MELFSTNPNLNLLPRDGMVNDYGTVLSAPEADQYFFLLMKCIPWRNDEVVMYGKRIVTARKVAWYGDVGCHYTYSGTTKQAIPWNAPLRELKDRIECLLGCAFNSCLANLYENGRQGMAWHSDDEKSLGRHNTIASLSLGAERKFSFKHKSQPLTQSLILPHGGLLVMRGTTQAHWRHCLPPSAKIKTPRINLTFRTILSQD